MIEAFDRFADRVKQAFGDGREPIALVARRAEALLGDERIIVWEGDAQTFQATARPFICSTTFTSSRAGAAWPSASAGS
jgi:hypothetical protein